MDNVERIRNLDLLEKIENRKKRKISRRRNLMADFDDAEFQQRFRLTKESVIEITKLIEKDIDSRTNLNNALSPVEQVLITLRFYAVASMQLAIGDLFDISQPTVSRVINRVSEALSRLRQDCIYLPKSVDECKEVSRKFFSIAGFPGVIGALDGTFVRIQSPGGDNAERFRCRKNYFALNIQTIIDADLVIRDVVARWPGSTHDSRVFQNSTACLTLQTNPLFTNYHLLGDRGYGCEQHLLTPLGNPTSRPEVRYNNAHVLTRNTIERKYGILKRRFPCLSLGLKCNVERVPAIVVACCVLHNLAIRLDDPEPPVDPEIESLLQQLEQETESAAFSIASQTRCAAGFAKRKSIISSYFSH